MKPLQRGFSLIEIMVVVVILAILGAAVVPSLLGQTDKARYARAQADIAKLDSMIELYKIQTGVFPSTEQGLYALVRKPAGEPEPRNYPQNGYIKKLSQDPWGNDYIYVYPGEHGPYDIFSLGADGQEGGEGFDADITNWDQSKSEG